MKERLGTPSTSKAETSIPTTKVVGRGIGFSRATSKRTSTDLRDSRRRDWREGLLGRPFSPLFRPVELLYEARDQVRASRVGGHECLSRGSPLLALRGSHGGLLHGCVRLRNRSARCRHLAGAASGYLGWDGAASGGASA